MFVFREDKANKIQYSVCLSKHVLLHEVQSFLSSIILKNRYFILILVKISRSSTKIIHTIFFKIRKASMLNHFSDHKCLRVSIP